MDVTEAMCGWVC